MSRGTSNVLAFPPPARNEGSGWVRWLLPSVADIFFLVLLVILAFGPISRGLLNDSDTGWHIRNGEIILTTLEVPRTDPFSYTRAGEPWFAWEWLYDVGVALLDRWAGLNGVVLFTAATLAATFALLFRVLLARGRNFVAALALTMLTAAASQVHMLARPHVLSWLFTLVFVERLYRFEHGRGRELWWLAPLTMLWANVHGGFVMGLVLIFLFAVAALWRWTVDPSSFELQKLARLSAAFLLCTAATFATPYGYRLHWHIYEYLSNSFFMNSIQEFMSPNFHSPGFGFFEALVLLTFVACGLARARLRASDVLVIVFAIHAGLYATRNVPLAAILLAVAVAPILGEAIRPQRQGPEWWRTTAQSMDDLGSEMAAMEANFRGHALALAALVMVALLATNGGRIGSLRVMNAQFDASRFPVRAAEFIEAQGIREQMFNTDDWSGYLIYRLHPRFKVYFDDRHDFYGEQDLRDYLSVLTIGRGWRTQLARRNANWVLLAEAAPLADLLRSSDGWEVIYSDGVAIIFHRSK